MAVTVTKHKTKIKKKPVQKQTTASLDYMRSIADEAGALKDKIAGMKLKLSDLETKYKVLVGPIQKQVDSEFDAKASLHASGDEYTCKVGVKGNKTIVTDVLSCFQKFKELGGDAMLEKVMKFGITDIKNYLTPTEQEEIIKIEATGNRKVDFIKK